MSKKLIGAIVIMTIAIIGGVTLLLGNLHRNDTQNYQVVQALSGETNIRDRAGVYVKFFPTVWTWPRADQKYYSEDVSGAEGGNKDESIMCTFNDGGQAKISTMIRFQLPVKDEQRIALHKDFSGNPENVTHSIRSHMINCIKATAPLMKSSEHQTARKAEFTQLVHEQMQVGLFKMLKEERDSGKKDKTGSPIMSIETEIVYTTDKDGVKSPVIAQISPLKQYGITILQFSITGSNYDKQTREQFAAKKDMFQKSEKMKAEREQEVQATLMVEQKGLREKAEVTAKGNVLKEAATIKATQEKEMAIITAAQKVAVEEAASKEAVIKAEKEKLMAEIAASLKVTVESQVKLEEEVRLVKELMIETKRKEIALVNATKLQEVALIDADKKLKVAEIEKAEATAKAAAMVSLAEAKQKQIELSGAITEQEQVRLEIAKDTQVLSTKAFAEAIRGLNLPSTVIVGGDSGKGQSSSGGMDQLMKLFMLKTINGSTPAATTK